MSGSSGRRYETRELVALPSTCGTGPVFGVPALAPGESVQKALLQMNIQLSQAVTDVMGMTGQMIIRAIVAGISAGNQLREESRLSLW